MAANTSQEQTPIETFVIFKVETTDRPWDGGLQSRVVELCSIAVPRTLATGDTKQKFYRMVNPERTMSPEASQATGIFFEIFNAKNPTFEELYDDFVSFLETLPKPICLVAHNGNAFDFRMLRYECNQIAEDYFPIEILTADSLRAFQNLLKGTEGKKKYALPDLCKRFFGKDVTLARAQEKAKMLLKIIVKNGDFFRQWADANCKPLMEINSFYGNTSFN